jgi:FkbM family methyltransferase
MKRTSDRNLIQGAGSMIRFPSKTNSLRFLREAGVPIGTVLDVGAHAETLELRSVFPDKRHLLFEPATEFHAALRKNYAGMDYHMFPMALSDQNGEGNLRKIAIDGGAVSHAMLVDTTDGGPSEKVRTMRLDSFMNQRDDPKPYLLKIDVDGYEIPVIRGSEGILRDVSCLIVEAPTSALGERLDFVLTKGFKLFDLVDQCYYFGVMSQVYMIFLCQEASQLPELRPWETKPFDWKGWVPIADFENATLRNSEH